MKRSVKAVVVTAVAMALGGVGTSVNAATLYDEEGTQFDIYGRLAMGVAGGGPGVDSAGQKVSDSAEFVDVYSRLGFRMSQRVSSDVSAFGRWSGASRVTSAIPSKALMRFAKVILG
ncbi:hypothetical protein DK37_23465 [Halomonas sp. SUBG004]|nr:hypothetical protein DK37_23465 [Halomonas sp. SUBG004]